MSVHFTEEWARKYEQRTGKKVHGLSNPTKQDKPKRTKYGNMKTPVGNKIFDSGHEADRYKQLVLLEKANEITALKTQVKFLLVPKQAGNRAVTYKADFTYYDCKTNQFVVEDAKGFKTDTYKIKKKLMFKRFGIEIREV